MTRRALIDQLGSELQSALAAGEGWTVRLIGEAGIGKSTIVDELVDRARAAGADVWCGAANELDRSRPLASLGTVRAQFGSMPAGDLLIGEVPTRQRPQRGAAGLVSGVDVERLVELDDVVDAVERAAQRPVLLVLDDVHWADVMSLEALIACARVALTHPLCFVMTQRPGPADAGLDRLNHGLATAACRDVVVEPLSPAEVADLLRELCGGSPTAALAERCLGAAGNPFLLREYVDGLLANGDLVIDDADVGLGTLAIPVTLREAMRRELSRLGSDVADVLRAASVQGRVVNVSDVVALLDRTPISLSSPIEAAVRAGLLEEVGSDLRFRHDLVRLAVYEQMPEALRMATHRQLAEVLAQRAAPAALIGSHLVLGVDNGDAEAIERLRAAADEVAIVDPIAALAFLDRARTFAHGDIDTLRVIERARMEALTGAGQLAEAESAVRWLLDVSPPEAHAELWARLGGIATLEGNSRRALTFLDRAAEQAMTDLERSQLLALTSLTSAVATDYVRAWTAAEQAVELGDRIDDPVGKSAGRAIMARLSTFTNSLEDGLRQSALAVSIAETDATGFSHLFVPCLHYGMTAFDADRFDIAGDMVRRGFELAESNAMVWSRPLFGSLAAGLHFRLGEIDGALAEAETAVDLAIKTSSMQSITWAYSICSLVSAELGDAEAARRGSEAADAAEASGRSPLGIDHAALARGRARLVVDDLEGAVSVLKDAWDDFEERGLIFCQPVIAPDLGRVAHRLGRHDLLATVADATVAAGDASGVSAIAAHGALLQALGADDRAGGQLAIAQLDRSGRRLDAATWRAWAPDLVDRDAIGALHTALEYFDRMGCVGSADGVRMSLSERGVDAVEIGGVEGNRWETLTPTEAEITALLASGLTNAQIAQQRGGSRRTVESHLGRVYQKLRIDGRVALTVAAAEHFRSIS